MAERLKAVASKAIVRIADRGFESLSLRQSSFETKLRTKTATAKLPERATKTGRELDVIDSFVSNYALASQQSRISMGVATNNV